MFFVLDGLLKLFNFRVARCNLIDALLYLDNLVVEELLLDFGLLNDSLDFIDSLFGLLVGDHRAELGILIVGLQLVVARL